MRVKTKPVLDLLKETLSEWSEDNAARLGAALSYYTIFSIAPLLIIVIYIVGMVWGNQSGQVRAEIINQIQSLTGPQGGEAITTMLDNASSEKSEGVLATVLGFAALLFGATGVFAQLQGALNTIWDVKLKPGGGIKAFLQTRVLSFGMILAVGFLLLVSLVVSTVLTAMSNYLSELMPGTGFVWQIVNIVVSFAVITLLFAMIYKILPDVEIDWRDVWIGAAITALLFTLGKFAIGLYLGHSSAASTYGAAGSLVVLLLWIYYSAQIFFLGAEFTQVYARRYGTRIQPSRHAMRIPEAGEVCEPDEATEPTNGKAPVQQVSGGPVPVVRQRPSALKRVGALVAVFLVGRFLGKHSS